MLFSKIKDKDKTVYLILGVSVLAIILVSFCALKLNNVNNLISDILLNNYSINQEMVNNYLNVMSKTYILLLACIAIITFMIFVLGIIIIVQNKQTAKEIAEAGFTDSFTHLSNELGFYDKASKLLENSKGKSYTIVEISVNNLKFIDNKFNYNTTEEEIISCIANTLHEMCGEKGIVGRISTGNFIIMLENKEKLADNIMKEILSSIEKLFGERISRMIKLSAGYYIFLDIKDDVRSAASKASVALDYAKKIQTTNIKEYDEELFNYYLRIKEIESNQQYALENGEFKVYFQPKFDLQKDCICGAEALVRWYSEKLGFLQPSRFIPIFEENGFIEKVDFYVLEEVCKHIKKKIDADEPVIKISVNQSRITMMGENYIDNIKKMFEKYKTPVEAIDFEITESLFIGDYTVILEILSQLKDMGISISMDDFGSGYSSLNLLKEMPIDNLKLDKVFLDETNSSKEGRIIIKSVIGMAKELDIKVICEGVETKEQVNFLKNISCEVAQGYYYDKPIPAGDFDEKFKSGQYNAV